MPNHPSVPARARRLLAIVCLLAAVRPGLAAAETILVDSGSAMRYLANDSDPGLGLDWVDAGFADAGWTEGSFGVGYDTETGSFTAQDLLASTVPAGVRSVYARVHFEVADAAAVENLFLGVDHDDGVVAWLNGVEVYRSAEMPAGAPGWNAAAGSHESSNAYQPNFTPLADVSAAGLPALADGDNVLAIGVWNTSGSSTDLVLVPRLLRDWQDTVVRGPYLQSGTASGVVVRWRTNFPTDSAVRYGTSPELLGAIAVDPAPAVEHQVALVGLAAGTRTYYSVGSSTATLAGGDEEHSFVTAPAGGGAQPMRVWVLGDPGTANRDAVAVRDAYQAFAAGEPPDLWLMLGDNAYPNGTDWSYQAAVFELYPGTLRRSVLWPAIGNHEGDSSDSDSESGPYFAMFTLPRQGEAGGIPSGTEAYYSFDHGNVHFVCLDSFGSDRSPAGAMMTWLRADLADATADWIVAFWHHPPYSKGSHDSDSEIELVDMREVALPILEGAGVDLVLSGHSHSYERSFLLDGHYDVSSTFTEAMKVDPGDGRPDGDGAYRKPSGNASRAGGVYAVAGSSGRTTGGSLDHPAMLVSLDELGSLVLDVDGSRLDAAFLDAAGAVRDNFAIVKGAAVPPRPADLAAAAVSESAIDLTWTASGGDEQGYEIERSLDLAAWSLVATVAADVTAFSDTGLSPATTYSYRVRAFNPAGRSPYSNVASATTSGCPECGLVVRRINAAGLDFTDGSGKLFVADKAFADGDFGYLGGTPASFASDIAGTGDDPLYQTIRGGASFSYLFDGLPAGVYQVTLFFTEPWFNGPGLRLFDVTAEGALVLDDLDVFAASGGKLRAHAESFPVAVGDGRLEIAFAAVRGNNAIVSALAVVGSEPPPLEPDIDVVPASLAFGPVVVGEAAEATLTIANSGSLPLTVSRLDSTDPAFSVLSPVPPLILAPQASAEVVVEFRPDAVGAVAGELEIGSDDPDEGLIVVELEGQGVEETSSAAWRLNAGGLEYTASTGEVFAADRAYSSGDFGYLGGVGVSFNSEVSGTSDDPLYQAMRGGTSFSYKFDGLTGGDYAVTLYFTEPWFTGPGSRKFDVTVEGTVGLDDFDVFAASGGKLVAHTEELVATVSDGQLEVGFRSVVGTAIVSAIRVVALTPPPAEPDIAVSPASVDFGPVLVGGAGAGSVTVGNAGALPLTVAALTSSDADFVITGPATPFVVAPGGSAVVSLEFRPVGLGSQTATLEVASDDPDEGLVEVALSGEGVAGLAVERRIDAGGAADYTDGNGKVFVADKAFVPGDFGYLGGTSNSFASPVAGTGDDPLYQSLRGGTSFSYDFDGLPDGSYELTLYFTEPWFNGAGQRLFNVVVEGTTRLPSFDVYAASGGKNVAHAETLLASVSDGRLDVDFTGVGASKAIVSAVAVVTSGGPP